MSRFETDTAVTPQGDGRYTATIDRTWWIINGPNGGYIAAVVGRAMEAAVADGASADELPKRIHSLTLHYLRPPAEGEATIDVVVERRGRSVATVTARMSQGGQLLVIGIAAVASGRTSHDFDDLVPPTAPAPEDLPPMVRPAESPGVPMSAQFDMLPCLGSATSEWGPDTPPMPAVSGGWIRFTDPTPIDAVALAAISDAWFPPVFHRLPGTAMAVPTVDLTVHVRQLPADPLDWVLVRFASPQAVGGYLIEDGELWDRHGKLLAVSRQLAVLV